MFGAPVNTLLSKRKTPLVSTILVLFAVFPATSSVVRADPPSDMAERAKVIGQPVALTVQPAKINLAGPLATQQIVISGSYGDGSWRDLTSLSEVSLGKSGFVSVAAGGFVEPQANGETTLTVSVGGKKATIPVTVSQFNNPKPVSFRHDM